MDFFKPDSVSSNLKRKTNKISVSLETQTLFANTELTKLLQNSFPEKINKKKDILKISFKKLIRQDLLYFYEEMTNVYDYEMSIGALC